MRTERFIARATVGYIVVLIGAGVIINIPYGTGLDALWRCLIGLVFALVGDCAVFFTTRRRWFSK
jgi:hypothetical protein